MRGLLIVVLLACFVCTVGVACASQSADTPKKPINVVSAGAVFPNGWEGVTADTGWTVGLTHLDTEKKFCAMVNYAQYDVSAFAWIGYQPISGSATHRFVSAMVGPAYVGQKGEFLTLLVGASHDQANASVFTGGYELTASADKTEFVWGAAGGIAGRNLGVQAVYQQGSDKPFQYTAVAATFRF
jgi:hypothetical protein